MNDCPNADVRDLLPDLVHARLDAGTRGMVDAHVAGCADCREELALLRDMSATLRSRTPQVDVAGIVAAIPAHRAPVRRSWVGWRTAAAITMIAAGGSSVVMLRHDIAPVTDSLAVLPAVASPEPVSPSPITQKPRASQPVPSVKPVAPAVQRAPAVSNERELAMAGGTMHDLNEKELASLLRDIEKMDAMPSADVESPAIAPISPRVRTP
ncbi:MAG: hypothetical protein JWM95_5275 [Gemmatimonadetes bacterium]|nr:hypothetical protein [Gemmatimonadota bacterium]